MSDWTGELEASGADLPKAFDSGGWRSSHEALGMKTCAVLPEERVSAKRRSFPRSASTLDDIFVGNTRPVQTGVVHGHDERQSE